MRYWTEKFGVSADQLRQAVKAAGSIVKDVEQGLGKAKDHDQRVGRPGAPSFWARIRPG
jgi:hypothetical protein